MTVKVPLRISFFGGGSDIPEFYEEIDRYGYTLSTTIDKFVYVETTFNEMEGFILQITNENKLDTYQKVYCIDDITSDIVRNTLILYNSHLTDENKLDSINGLKIKSSSDIPFIGNGLGGSSAFTIALLRSLYRYWVPGHAALAEDAFHIERNLCNYPVGKQDQYAAAFTGLNLIKYEKNSVFVQEFNDIDLINNFHSKLLLIPTNITRNSSLVLNDIKENIGKNKYISSAFHACAGMAFEAAYLLQTEKYHDEIGELLHQAWMLKKETSKFVSNPQIDELYDFMLAHGASGGKLLGAGGGGYMLGYWADQKKKESFKELLKSEKNIECLDFNFYKR